MTHREIKNKFLEKFGTDMNFVTDQPIRYGESEDHIYELSYGKIMGNHAYGVTVLTKEGEDTDLHSCFSDPSKSVAKEEAETYIREEL